MAASDDTTLRGRFLESGAGEKLDFFGIQTDFKCRSEWVGGAYTLVEQVIPARKLMPPHVHTREDQVTYVLTGQVGFMVGDEQWTGGPGCVSVRPRGIVHALWNPSDQPARIVEITSPGAFQDYVRSCCDILAGTNSRALPSVAEQQGITFVPELNAALCEMYGLIQP